MLSFVVTPADDYKNNTKGLMGTWNDDPEDDFLLPDGTVIPPSSTSRGIHFEFGVKCEYTPIALICLCIYIQYIPGWTSLILVREKVFRVQLLPRLICSLLVLF